MYPKRFGSELAVIARAKDLADYVFEATHKSPKVFRITFVSRMQDFMLDVVEQLCRANEVFVAHALKAPPTKIELCGLWAPMNSPMWSGYARIAPLWCSMRDIRGLSSASLAQSALRGALPRPIQAA